MRSQPVRCFGSAFFSFREQVPERAASSSFSGLGLLSAGCLLSLGSCCLMVLSATCPQFAPLQIDPKSPPDFPAPEKCVLISLSLHFVFLRGL
jgi:hypothetical protein